MRSSSLEPAYVIHRRAYRETSLILEAFTRHHGRMGLLAKGARRSRSGRAGLLQPFRPLLLSWGGRGELQVLIGADAQGPPIDIPGDRLAHGFYLNELLLRLLAREDPHPELFDCYHRTLADLVSPDDVVLRRFEVALLQEIGYGFELTQESGGGGRSIKTDRYYRVELERGPTPVDAPSRSPWVVSGATLLGLASGDLVSKHTRREARLLMSEVLNHYLGGRPVRSRELLKKSWKSP